MSCAYRHAAARIATIAGIPTDLMLMAMDIARQQRVTFPDLPPDRLRTIAPFLGIIPTCGNPQQVIARIQSALLALGTLHPTHPCIERWMAIAAALGVPNEHLPVPVHPDVLATVRAPWAAPPSNPDSDLTTAGIAALWQGDPIPDELIEEALRTDNQMAIVTWMAYGVWDNRFTDVCRRLTDAEIGILVRVGVMPDALVEQVAQRWWSDTLPWDGFPVTLWDRVPNPEIARKGCARTAAAKLVRNPTLRDDQLIAAAAKEPRWAGHVLIARRDLSDKRLIAAAAKDPAYARNVLLARPDLRTETRLITAAADPDWWAYDVLIKHPNRYTDERLITVAAQQPSRARDVLVARHDLSDKRLIDAVARNAGYARDVLVARHDLSDDRLIDAVATHPWYAQCVLNARRDLSDARLIDAVAEDPQCARDLLCTRHDLRDDCLIDIVAEQGTSSDARDVLLARHDLSDDRLIDAVAVSPWDARVVLIVRRDLSDDRLIAAVARDAAYARNVLHTRPDLRTNTRLLTAIARDRALLDDVLTQYPDLRDHPILAAMYNADRTSG